jgi:hypothetical protein
MKDVVKFIEEAIKDLDVFVEKRGDGYAGCSFIFT